MKQGRNKILVNIAKKSTALRRIYRKIESNKNQKMFSRFAKKRPIDQKLIVFEAYHGKKYTCSPKAIYEEMIKDDRFKDFSLVWAFQDIHEYEDVEELKRAKIVDYNSEAYYEFYAKAKYIVTNSINVKIPSLREGQTYIQTWHGTPLKKLGFDLSTEKGSSLNSLKEIADRYGLESKKINYMVSPSKFTTEKLTSSFRLAEYNSKAQVVETGYPRNDYLINHQQENIIKIKENIGIKDNKKKIILYAPTFRDNSHDSAIGYTYDLGFEINNLKKQLDLEKHKDFIINATDYPEINELYIISDLLITDYSSVFFDFAVLGKPIIFYMYDLKEYRDHIRGFYVDLKELPGEIVEKEENLIKAIRDAAKFTIDSRYKKFNDKYNYLEDGKASKRVIEECITKHTQLRS